MFISKVFLEQDVMISLKLRMSYHVPSKVWDEITYPLQNFNVVAVEVWELTNNVLVKSYNRVITYPCWDYS